MKLFVASALLIMFTSAAAQSTKFERDGISFNWTDDWAITEKDSAEGTGYYLAVERLGFSESGLVTVTWSYGDAELEEVISAIENSLKSQPAFKENLKVSKPFKSKYGNNDCIAAKFSSAVMGIEHEGIIYCFKGHDKVISIIRQEALEDKSKNVNGFAAIESSFENK